MVYSVYTVTRPDYKFRHPNLDDADQTLFNEKCGLEFSEPPENFQVL